jgi:cytochrome bd-type quinol oxidase subunit 2
MFRNLRNTIVSLLAAATLVAVPLAVPALASADGGTGIQSNLCGGATLTVDSTGNCSDNTSSTKLDSFIKDLVNVFSIVVGVVAVIMIIVGGFRYITSGGDSGQIGTAKNTIIYAIIGLVIVALAQFIVQFVLNKVGNLNG